MGKELRSPLARPQLFDEDHARFLLRLPVDLFDGLSALAEKRELSLNTLLNGTLTAFFEAQPEHDAMVRERPLFRKMRAAARAAKARRKTRRK